MDRKSIAVRDRKGNSYFLKVGSMYFKDHKGGRNSADANYEAVDCIWKNPSLCEPNVSIEVANSQKMKGPRGLEKKAVLYTHKDSPVPIVIFIDLPYPDSAPDDLYTVFGNLFCFENSYIMAHNQTMLMHDEDPNFALATQKRANYTFAEDDALVDAVLHYKPMRGTVSHTWEDVHSELDPLFPAAREVKFYKKRFYTLLTKWKANEAKARWASGTAEQITAIKPRKTVERRTNKQRLLDDQAKGKKIRSDALETLKPKKRLNTTDEEEGLDTNSNPNSDVKEVPPIKKPKKVRDIDCAIARRMMAEDSVHKRRVMLEVNQLKFEESKLKLEEKKHDDQMEIRRQELAIEKQKLDMKRDRRNERYERDDRRRRGADDYE
ncbi:hypothetical protein BV898_10090 [Hypsibius exemplaris]|uniref:Uncharacterized protein n=1 Tax=Hypsibius exemplaris TaxID=2072580 RepID=A0A1W0WKV0_HYPEX|nr:hypothetical protein BV898_10090 [Hypsibius exemplaris]